MKKYIIISVAFFASLFLSGSRVFATEAPLLIKAINPGYTVNGETNVGEFIELFRPHPDGTPLSLTNVILGYTNSSGNAIELFAFPEASWMNGETLLLRFASSPESELADATYSKTLAMSAGPLILSIDGEVVDSACWTGRMGCSPAFSSANPTTLVRDATMLAFAHQPTYSPFYDSNNPSYSPPTQLTPVVNPIEPISDQPASDYPAIPPTQPQCRGLIFSEIFTYYISSQSEQFIEFYNPLTSPITLDGCSIRYKNKTHSLSGTVLPKSYFVYVPASFSLTKSPTTTNTLELLDTDGTILDSLTYPAQKKSTSFAKISLTATDGAWQSTYAITKGSANLFQQYKSCEEGKIINETTGNCVKIPVVVEKTCDEGYFLNPATNRCKKLTKNTGADYGLSSATKTSEIAEESFIALYAVIGILVIGVIYITLQFREELGQLFGRVFRRFLRVRNRAPDPH